MKSKKALKQSLYNTIALINAAVLEGQLAHNCVLWNG